MSITRTGVRPGLARHAQRPPHAAVGSQVNTEEQIFAAFDGRIMRRFWAFISPYRLRLVLAVLAVLAFAASQIAIPLILRTVIDDALAEGAEGQRLLTLGVLVFFGIVTVNFLANLVQETLVGRITERLLIDLRRAMFAHLQRVSLSFMDKTEVGRLMSRLQGDVQALQEFLETSVFAIGDFVLLAGITVVLLVLDRRLGLLTLSVVPILVVVRVVWAAGRQARLPACEGYQLDPERRARGRHSRGPHGSGHGARGGQPAAVRGEGRGESRRSAARHLARPDDGADRRHAHRRRHGDRCRGGRRRGAGGPDLGVMVAFLFYVQRFFDPIRSLTMQYSIMQRAMASGQRIIEVLDVPIEVRDKPDALDPASIDGSVEFRNVTFGYVPGMPILKNVSFRVEPGETVALVGPTGSGKTSTMALCTASTTSGATRCSWAATTCGT